MSRMKQSGFLALALIVTSLGFVCSIRAQEEDTGDDPSRGVARISVIQGEVNLRRGDSGDMVAAAINAPLIADDHVQTAEGSKAEVQFDYGNMVRLAPDTDLGFADVRYHHYQMQLGAGTITYRVLRDANSEAEIDTPSVAIRPQGGGEYRISVHEDGTTEITVRSGRAEISGPSGSQQLGTGTTMLVRGASSDPEFQETAAIPRDQFDDWNHYRDSQLLRSRSYQYVSTDIYGADDLDDYGTWVSSEYGAAWRPRVSTDWAPYRAGRWVWEDYYGWTWVSSDPWGWAPYHYGRWFWNGGAGWCWWPGAVRSRYYWRPALVAFFGFGGGGVGLNVGFGFGNVGWIPLAPYERWHPWYGRGYYGRGWGAYGNRTTIVNNINVYNSYRNARINNGLTYTNFNQFGRGHSAFYSGNGAQIRGASLVRGGLPIAPGRESLALSNRGVIRNPRLSASEGQRFFSRQAPANRERVPFAQQQEHMAQFQQRTLGIRTTNTGYSQTRMGDFGGARGVQPAVAGQPSAAPGGGWRRVGEHYAQSRAQGAEVRGMPGQGMRQAYPQTPIARPNDSSFRQGQQQGGWRRLGQNPAAGDNSGQNNPGTFSRRDQSASPSSTENGWQRFGSSGRGNPRTMERPVSPGTDSAGWHRFGATPEAAPRQGNTNSNRSPYSQYQSSSRPNYGNFRNEAPRSEPLRITQPMVRERPNYEGSRGYGGSAPRESAPHYSTPAYRSGGGNYGGSGRGEGRSTGGSSAGDRAEATATEVVVADIAVKKTRKSSSKQFPSAARARKLTRERLLF